MEKYHCLINNLSHKEKIISPLYKSKIKNMRDSFEWKLIVVFHLKPKIQRVGNPIEIWQKKLKGWDSNYNAAIIKQKKEIGNEIEILFSFK
ncbi:hypothetical protein ACJX0J_019559, partial [Zea mays]